MLPPYSMTPKPKALVALACAHAALDQVGVRAGGLHELVAGVLLQVQSTKLWPGFGAGLAGVGVAGFTMGSLPQSSWN